MTQRSSELHAARSEAEDIERIGDGASEPRVITSEFRSMASGAAAPDERAADAQSPDGTRESEDPSDDATPDPRALAARLDRVERQNRRMRYGLLALVLVTGYALYDDLFPEGVRIQKTMMESKELKLLDNEGNPRLFLRMYSRVPVLQILDSNGKPRMSLGLRFDDTPFLDLSDKTGRTRATFEMTEEDAPALRLFDENGDTTFKMN